MFAFNLEKTVDQQTDSGWFFGWFHLFLENELLIRRNKKLLINVIHHFLNAKSRKKIRTFVPHRYPHPRRSFEFWHQVFWKLLPENALLGLFNPLFCVGMKCAYKIFCDRNKNRPKKYNWKWNLTKTEHSQSKMGKVQWTQVNIKKHWLSWKNLNFRISKSLMKNRCPLNSFSF